MNPNATDTLAEHVQLVRLADMAAWERNPHKHPENQLSTLASLVRRFGFTSLPVLATYPGCETGFVSSGNGRLAVLRLLKSQYPQNPPPGIGVAPDGEWLIPCRPMAFPSKAEAEAQGLSDNWVATMPGVEDDSEILADILRDLEADGVDFSGLGKDADELAKLLAEDFAPAEPGSSGGTGEGDKPRSLSERFGVPPFSVLDARQGYWQERKRAWLAYGIRSHEGRGDAHPGGSPRPATRLGDDGKTARGDGVGKRLTWVAGDREDLDPTSRKNLAAGGSRGLARSFGQDLMRGEHKVGQAHTSSTTRLMELAGGFDPAEHGAGTSIFDPVLCELGYRWFAPKGGTVLDPFAGGSVRGVVAAACGLQYIGVDLRQEQVDANRQQWQELEHNWPSAPTPVWHCSDSRLIPQVCGDVQADLIYSCPPYADLEVYSNNPQDLSTLDYPAFIKAYREIIAAACGRLKQDRFAMFIVGDVRDKRGFYQNFPGDTVNAFQDAGCTLYNEAILITAVGSLPLRVGKQFGSYRKLGKTHQNVLIFFKGNPKNIPDVLGECDFAEVASESAE